MTPTVAVELIVLQEAAKSERAAPGQRAPAAEALQMGLWRHREALLSLVAAHIARTEAA